MEIDAQATWDELAAEREGKPFKPAEKPVETPAAVVVEEAKPEPIDFAAKLAELENKFSDRLRKAEGHIGNLNGELKSLLDASKAAAKTTGEAPTQEAIKQAITNPVEWEELKVEFPEWAGATEKFLESRLNNFDANAFEEKLRKEMKGETEAVKKEIIDSALDAVYPGWKDEINTDEFKAWHAKQEFKDSDKVGDVAKILKAYEKSKEPSQANQLTEQRKQNLAVATAVPKGTRTTNTQKAWEDMTPEERWNHELKLKEKRNR